MDTKWLDWSRRIQAISQAGLHFSKDPYDQERYEELLLISAEIMNEYSNAGTEKIVDLYKNEKGYPTPKVDVRGVVFDKGKILMVCESLDGKWSLPGGFCEIGLSASENAVKEIKEEAGLDVKPIKLLAVLDMNKHEHPVQPYHYYKLFIQCEICGGKPISGLETKEVGFFSEDQLPPLSLNRNTEKQIHMLFHLYKHQDHGTVFD